MTTKPTLVLFLALVCRLAAQIEVVSDGKVGIGTTTPQVKLDLLGRMRFASSANETPTTGAGVEIQYRDLGPTIQGVILAFDRTAGAYKYLQIEGSTLALNVASGGKVGIGTTTPASQLHVYGGNPGVLSPYYSAQIRADSSGNTGLLLSTPQANAAYIYHNTPLDGASAGIKFDGNARCMSFFTVNGTARMRIDNVGNVGIGTDSPSYKLDVAGQVHATSFISNSTTYADFVFKPGYKLASLSETEAAIQRDGHLPGIPSEAEAKEHGIDLGAMQVKLLQKVEELTLHVIAQEKQIREQAGRIRQLEAVASSQNK